VVRDGTGKAAALEGYAVAGKTGTAQKVDPATGRYSGRKVVASFAGAVPAEDPRLAILVVIDEPQLHAWGGSIAAPTFREIAREALKYLRVPPAPPAPPPAEQRIAGRPPAPPVGAMRPPASLVDAGKPPAPLDGAGKIARASLGAH
jgi:cell division protein FtsI (penicillin-binding protein 3)